MIDDKLNAWLLEVNLSPSLSCESKIDTKVKAPMISDLFNLAGIVNNETINKFNETAKLTKRFRSK
jgi:hypothetical protein